MKICFMQICGMSKIFSKQTIFVLFKFVSWSEKIERVRYCSNESFSMANVWLKIPETENVLVYVSDNHDKKLKSKSRKNIKIYDSS